MSKFRFKSLEKYKTGGFRTKLNLSIPLPQSQTGKVHRCCPTLDCKPKIFQLGEVSERQSLTSDLSKLVRRSANTDGTTCPYCGYDGLDQEFTCQNDTDFALEVIQWNIVQDTQDFVKEMASNFNRKSKKGLLKPKLTEKTSRMQKPSAWREDLLRDLTCDICARRYGVYAIGLFCPDCGAKNVCVHFNREVEIIFQQIDLAREQLQDRKEFAYRLLGNAHEDVLTALETYLKTIYRFLLKKRLATEDAQQFSKKQSIGNKFQNVDRGRELFDKMQIDPFASLTEGELNLLRLNIEKRHIVGHNLSMADDKYYETGGKEAPGQTVIILSEEITQFANIASKVIHYIEDNAPEFYPAIPGDSASIQDFETHE